MDRFEDAILSFDREAAEIWKYSSHWSESLMNQQTSGEEWSRRVRLLDHTEVALLAKNALEIHDLMLSYDVNEPSDQLTADGLDVVFAEWLQDRVPQKTADSKLIAVLGITFGNYLCDRLSMQWVEVTDDAGTTYAVRHETAEVYCFPLEAVKKRVISAEIGFFSEIETAIRGEIAASSTKQRTWG